MAALSLPGMAAWARPGLRCYEPLWRTLGSVEPSVRSLRISSHSGLQPRPAPTAHPEGKNTMDNLTGLVAVTMLLGMPTAAFAMYTFYRVRKLRSEERMAAIARGITVPMAPDL